MDTDRFKQAFDVHIAEYNSLRDEFQLQESFQNSLMNYAIAITAGTLSLFAIGEPSVITLQPFLLLIASILMSMVTWASMDASYHANDISKYIQHSLVPKIQKIIGESNLPELIVLKWEEVKVYRSGRLVLKGIAQSGKFAVAFIPSMAFVLIYLSLQSTSIALLPLVDKILFWLACLLAAISLLGGLLNSLFIIGFGSNPFKEDSKNPGNSKK